MNDYNKTVQFQFPSAAFSFTIKDGLLKDVSIENKSPDLVVKTDADTVVDLLVWYSLDILSACLLGKVQIPQASTFEIMKLIKWFTQIQDTLRWLVLTRMDVPALRHRLQDWVNQQEDRSKRFAAIFGKNDSLFIGEKNLGGIILRWEANKVANVQLSTGDPGDMTFEILLDTTQLGAMFNGKIDLLYELLDNRQLKRISTMDSNFTQSREFFHSLPGKFRPERAGDLDLILQYTIRDDGEEDERWWIRIREQKLTVQQGTAPEASNAAVTINRYDFIKLINGLVVPVELVTKGKMALKGEPTLVLRMDGCFENIFGTGK
jgi:putative sterol carrier protein